MNRRRTIHIALAALAALLLIFGIYQIVRIVTVDGSASGSSTAGPDPADPGGVTADSPASTSDGEGDGDGGEGGDGGSEESGVARISGPTIDNVYPIETDGDGNYPASGGCLVLVNTKADISLQIQSISVQGEGQVRISDRPCRTPAAEASWNDLGVVDPVETCGTGTVLEPASTSPRHACNIRLDRTPGPAAGTAVLGVQATARCTTRAFRPCSQLEGRYSPSTGRPVSAIVSSTTTVGFRADATVTETPTDPPTDTPPTDTPPTDTPPTDPPPTEPSPDTRQPTESPGVSVEPQVETPALGPPGMPGTGSQGASAFGSRGTPGGGSQGKPGGAEGGT